MKKLLALMAVLGLMGSVAFADNHGKMMKHGKKAAKKAAAKKMEKKTEELKEDQDQGDHGQVEESNNH